MDIDANMVRHLKDEERDCILFALRELDNSTDLDGVTTEDLLRHIIAMVKDRKGLS